VATQYFQQLQLVVVVVVDRGKPAHHQVWTMEELAAALVPVAVAAQIQATVLTVDSAIMAVWELTVKVSPEVRVLDLM
jgi:hypothetical protein